MHYQIIKQHISRWRYHGTAFIPYTNRIPKTSQSVSETTVQLSNDELLPNVFKASRLLSCNCTDQRHNLLWLYLTCVMLCLSKIQSLSLVFIHSNCKNCSHLYMVMVYKCSVFKFKSQA